MDENDSSALSRRRVVGAVGIGMAVSAAAPAFAQNRDQSTSTNRSTPASSDYRRMNPKLRRQLRQGLLPRKRRHRHPRFEFRAVLLPLYAHLLCPFLDRSALAYRPVQKSGARKVLGTISRRRISRANPAGGRHWQM